jgi:uncharacterized protein YjbI with pentapeptide repeats
MVEENSRQTADNKEGRKPWMLRELGGKTAWDWLQLLIVPLALAAIGFWFTAQQDARQQRIESKQAQQAQSIESERAKAERKLAKERAQDEALQAYLGQMGSLLLDKNLRKSKEDSEVRTLARARTLTVFSRLDPSRKTVVMEFLVEAELVQSVKGRPIPIIRLGGADLSDAHMSDSDLSDAELSDTVLTGADLSYADLSGANLSDAHMSHADLRFANLSSADLSDAKLRYARLTTSNLRGADVSQADLTGADLLFAQDWTAGQLGGAYLGGATMPNGQKYEDWIKSKDHGKSSSTASPSSPSASSSAGASAVAAPQNSAP